MKPLKFQHEFKKVHRDKRQAERRVKNLEKKKDELIHQKNNVRNLLHDDNITASAIEQAEVKLDKTIDELRQVKKDLEAAQKKLSEIEAEHREVRNKFGKVFYEFCDKRIDKIREHLSEIKSINEEIEEIGAEAFKMGKMYVPALKPSLFNQIKKPIEILEKGKRNYGVS